MQQSTGHTAAQASFSWKPTHSVQSAGSMTKMSSPWLMAPFGHSGSQAPQLMHSSVIIVAMSDRVSSYGSVSSRPIATGNVTSPPAARSRTRNPFPGVSGPEVPSNTIPTPPSGTRSSLNVAMASPDASTASGGPPKEVGFCAMPSASVPASGPVPGSASAFAGVGEPVTGSSLPTTKSAGVSE